MIDDQIADFFYSFESDFLDLLFSIITFFGDEIFFIIFFSVLFWVYDKELTCELIIVLLISISINGSLKEIFQRTRPTFSGEVGKGVIDAEGYSMPSGHAQNSSMVWGYWGLSSKNKKVLLFFGFLILLIGFSRIYLVVHFLTDVIAGWTIGLGVILIIIKIKPMFLKKWLKLSEKVKVSTVSLISLILLIISLLPNVSDNYASTLATGAGVLLGIYVGKILEVKHIDFDSKKALKSTSIFVTRFLIGIISVATIYLGLKVLFDLIVEESILLRYVRYFFVGLTAAFLAPYLFTQLEKKLKLIKDEIE